MEKINFNPENDQERVLLGTTKDGAEVYDRPDSHLHNEGGMTPEILSTALAAIDTENKPSLVELVNFDRPIGETNCVEVGPEDEIVMVYRKGRSGQTPMVKNREPEPCDCLTVVLRKDRSKENAYQLATGYIGKSAPREPWDPGISTDKERQESEEYWQTHALIYNEDLIDLDRTREFEAMPEEVKEKELIRPQVFYAGLFVDPDDVYNKAKPSLEKPIATPHVTTAFKPGLDQLHLDQLGSNAKIMAVGYGNDGKNEGLLVEVTADDPEIQAACDALETPHITLSISEDGQAKDTAFLDFLPLEQPFEITGQYGLFMQGSVVNDKAKLASEEQK